MGQLENLWNDLCHVQKKVTGIQLLKKTIDAAYLKQQKLDKEVVQRRITTKQFAESIVKEMERVLLKA